MMMGNKRTKKARALPHLLVKRARKKNTSAHEVRTTYSLVFGCVKPFGEEKKMLLVPGFILLLAVPGTAYVHVLVHDWGVAHPAALHEHKAS